MASPTPRPRHSAASAESESARPARDPWAWMTLTAFVLALAVVVGRTTVTEILHDPLDVAPGSEALPRSAGPAVSVAIDLLACMPALLILLRRAIDRTYVLRWSWTAIAMMALAFWTLASTTWAADKYVALLGAMQWIAAASLLWAGVQLVRTWPRLRVTSAVVVGLTCVLVANSLLYWFIDVPDQRAYWIKNKTTLLQARGWKEDDFAARQFERNVLAGPMFGFYTSPNTLSALMVLGMVVAGGIMIQRIDHKEPIGWALAIAPIIPLGFWVIYHAQSRTAFATPFLAAAMLGGIALFGRRIRDHSRFAYFVGLLLGLLGILLIVGHGLKHGTLFHDSLTFRWQYWVGAARIFEQHVLRGIGWNNFGFYYLGTRLPQASEEVKDPHNLFVRCFVELGIVGGLLLVAWVLRLAWDLTRQVLPTAPAEEQVERAMPSSRDGAVVMRYTSLPYLACISGAGVLLSIIAGIDWSAGTMLTELLKQMMFFCVLMVGISLFALRSVYNQQVDTRPSPWLLYGVIVGLAAFLVHNLIDFSMFEPGPMLLFALLAGSALGIRQPTSAGKHRHTLASIIAFVLAGLIWMGLLIFVFIPITMAEGSARAADDLLRAGRAREATASYQAAYDTVPINADYALRGARAMIVGRAPYNQVQTMLGFALEANPLFVDAYLMRARYALSQEEPNLDQAARDFQTVLRLNPQDAELRMEYADLLFRAGQSEAGAQEFERAWHVVQQLELPNPKRNDAAVHLRYGDALMRIGKKADAQHQYSAALEWNDSLRPDDVRKFNLAAKQDIQDKIKSAD